LKAKIFAIALLSVITSLSQAQSNQTPQAAAQTETTSDIAPPEHPATPDQIREYLTLVNYVGTAHKMMVQMIKTSRTTSAPYYTASFWDDMESAIIGIDIITPVIPSYQKYFSEEDMAATIAFYKSPAGKRLLQAQPFISSQAGDVLRKAGQEVGRQVGLKHREEIEALVKKQTQNSPAKPASDTPATGK